MLTVARRIAPGVDWRQGDVAALPFPDASFDRVLCQMALMFFVDRAAAISEMARVVRPGGSVALMTPASLDVQPAWGPFVEKAVAVLRADQRLMEFFSASSSAGIIEDLVQLMTRPV